MLYNTQAITGKAGNRTKHSQGLDYVERVLDNSMKFLVIDDHPSYLEGVSLLLRSIMPDAIIITAKDGADAREKLKQHVDIDWILLDINLPDCSGVDLIHYFRKLKVLANIVVITAEDDPGVIDEVLKYCTNGFLTKDFDSRTLLECISAIENDMVYLSPKHTQMLTNYRSGWLRKRTEIEDQLSSRQQQTLLLIAEGFNNLEIADQLGIEECTIKKHVSSLMTLFAANNRTHCVAKARRLGLVD